MKNIPKLVKSLTLIVMIGLGVVVFGGCSKQAEARKTTIAEKTPGECSLTASGNESCCSTPPVDQALVEMANTGTEIEIVTLDNSIDALKNYFNDQKSKMRFVALLSPNCGWCIKGAKSIRQALLKAHPDDDISISIVWLDMVNGDNVELVKKHAPLLSDPRVRHFYDAKHLVGKSIAKALGGQGNIAWDIYLFYGKDAQWKDVAPRPEKYMHQLGPKFHPWADQSYYYCGDALTSELYKAMELLNPEG